MSIYSEAPRTAKTDPFSITRTDTHDAPRILDAAEEHYGSVEHYSVVERVKHIMWDNQLVINTFIAGECFVVIGQTVE